MNKIAKMLLAVSAILYSSTALAVQSKNLVAVFDNLNCYSTIKLSLANNNNSQDSISISNFHLIGSGSLPIEGYNSTSKLFEINLGSSAEGCNNSSMEVNFKLTYPDDQPIVYFNAEFPPNVSLMLSGQPLVSGESQLFSLE